MKVWFVTEVALLMAEVLLMMRSMTVVVAVAKVLLAV